MNRQQSLLTSRGMTDASDRLLVADEPLADLQESCGGSLPGMLAVPELLELVRQGRKMGVRIAREFTAFDGAESVSGFARIHPLGHEQGGGCELLVENWHRTPRPDVSASTTADLIDAIDRASAEVTARLDAQQQVQLLHTSAADALELQAAITTAPAKPWSEYVELQKVAHRQPLHWRLLDGTSCTFAGSARQWRVRLIPMGHSSDAARGFELLLIADQPLSEVYEKQNIEEGAVHSRMIGTALTPALRQPIARIIANAETIRARLAGPLRAEYSEYAGNISAAGQHLSGMLDDLADLEVVESPGFSTASEKVDLCDAARRASGILGVRAQHRGIKVAITEVETPVVAIAEFRRVLQILINLIGNAIAYSPEGSTVTVTAQIASRDSAEIFVIDRGPGVDPDQAARIFDKFERLGRDSDGGNDSGSGLGLYISRKLALAMKGDLEVALPATSEDAAGAVFKLSLPAAD